MFQFVGATLSFSLAIVAFRGAFPSRTNSIFVIASILITSYAGLFATPIFSGRTPGYLIGADFNLLWIGGRLARGWNT